jgi:hypothetical protein
MAEGESAKSGSEGQRDSLDEVGANQLAGAEHRIYEKQQDDHERSSPHRGEADQKPREQADSDGRHRPGGHFADRARAGVRAATVEHHAQCHRGRTEEQHGAEDALDVGLRGVGVAHQVQQVGPEEGGRDGSDGQPLHQVQTHGSLPQMHRGPERAHHDGGHQVAGNGHRRLDVEEQHQHGCHERAASSAGHADQETDNRTPQNDVRVQALSLICREGLAFCPILPPCLSGTPDLKHGLYVMRCGKARSLWDKPS